VASKTHQFQVLYPVVVPNTIYMVDHLRYKSMVEHEYQAVLGVNHTVGLDLAIALPIHSTGSSTTQPLWSSVCPDQATIFVDKQFL
jgi:hypothetical protein